MVWMLQNAPFFRGAGVGWVGWVGVECTTHLVRDPVVKRCDSHRETRELSFAGSRPPVLLVRRLLLPLCEWKRPIKLDESVQKFQILHFQEFVSWQILLCCPVSCHAATFGLKYSNFYFNEVVLHVHGLFLRVVIQKGFVVVVVLCGRQPLALSGSSLANWGGIGWKLLQRLRLRHFYPGRVARSTRRARKQYKKQQLIRTNKAGPSDVHAHPARAHTNAHRACGKY